jgi:lipid-A-disaccharide synthase
VLISTGEPSGDAVGAALLREMRALGFDGKAYAVGSVRLRDAGAEIIANSSTWGALGVYQAVKKAPRLIAGGLGVFRWIKREKPDLVIAIDFGFMNVRACKVAKKCDLKTFYFLPPGSWRRDRAGDDLPAIADRIATQFPWSEKMLRDKGANVQWVGHPVKQMVGDVSSGVRPLLAILPGSRRHEIELNLPVMARATQLLERELSGLTITIACAPTADGRWVQTLWSRHCSLPATVTQDGAINALKYAKAAIVCSGTATLEAAICKTPMVVVYVLDKLMVAEAKLVRLKFDFIAQPSILLNRLVAPELFYVNATPERVAQELKPLLTESDARRKQLADFDEIETLLGPGDAITRAARIALEILQPLRDSAVKSSDPETCR